MPEPIREELTVSAERTLLVGLLLRGQIIEQHDPLRELRSLAKTASADVVDEIVSKRDKPHPRTYIGLGKAEQIAQRVEQNEINVVVFDNDLSPAQIRELEGIFKCKVLDRSELILDIFATHAQTAQARLQVELAQLEYTYPRLTGMWTHLDRHGGGVGTRGPGETQIETDRRIVQKRLRFLKGKLDAIDRRKLREVKARKDQFCVCLVGYTNAGKSTMMNLLTGADTYVADKLFATLETRTRQWDMSRQQSVLLSDTVGFVRDLPHHLVASFRATLEEAIHADLLIHVADASNELVSHQIQAVEGVLDELGCDRSRGLLVLNKIDQVNDPTLLTVWRNQYPESLCVSAVTGEGTEALAQAVQQRSSGGAIEVTLEANFRNGRLMQFIAQHGELTDQQYGDHVVTITGTFSQKHLDLLQQFGEDIVQLDD